MDAAARIEALSDFEIDLLVVLVFAERAPGPRAWARAAREHGISSNRPPGGALDPQEVAPIASSLLAAALIEPGPGQGTYAVPPAITPAVLRQAQARGRLARLAEPYHRRMLPRGQHGRSNEYRPLLHLAAVADDRPAAAEVFEAYCFRDRLRRLMFLRDTLGPLPEPTVLAVLPDKARVEYLLDLVDTARAQLRPLPEPVIEAALATGNKPLRMSVARLLIVRGQPDRARSLAPLPRWGREGLSVLEAFWRGDYAAAAELGDAAIAKMTTRKHKLLRDLEGACHMVATAAVCSTDPGRTQRLDALLEAGLHAGSTHHDVLLPLRDVLLTLAGDTSKSTYRPRAWEHGNGFMSRLVWLLHEHWLRERIEAEPPPRHHPPHPSSRDAEGEPAPPQSRIDTALATAERWHARATAAGFAPVARELSALVDALRDNSRGPDGHLASAFDPPAAWETALASLEASLEPADPDTDAPPPQASPKALWWELSVDDDFLTITPRIRQSARAKKGRIVALNRLMSRTDTSIEIDAADNAVLHEAELEPDDDHWHRHRPTHHLGLRAAAALVGHPRVINSKGGPMTVEAGTPTIVNTPVGDRIRVELRPAALVEQTIVVEQPSAQRVVIYQPPEGLDTLLAVLARNTTLEIPKTGHARLARTLARLSASANVNIEGALELGATAKAADPRPVVQLFWDGSTLEVRIRVAPLGPSGPHLPPGGGSASLVGECGRGKQRTLARCERDLDAERAAHNALLDACPKLASFAYAHGFHAVDALPDALDVLLELSALEDVTLTWAAGQKLDRPLQVNLDDLRIEVSTKTDWFGVKAALPVDETVLHFRQLLQYRQGGRFVPIGPGRFVELSEQLRRHLDALASLGDAKGDTLRVPPALAAALKELAEDCTDTHFDDEARARIEALATIAKWTPRIPRGFSATLRDYQREGYTWLARLARAGLGACLADDMGLGKTIQTLALLCHRARLGPALVVCPTSVVLNWAAEASRFAPNLRLHLLGRAADRQALLGSLRPGDVVVCSYGLLTTEADALAETEYSTAVFDEAHALKNARAQRTKAARNLRAQFRLGLTGTPVENNLGELWSLFRVILPGLLGSRGRFDEYFTAPIADNDRQRAAALRSILRPFLLRRTKAEVLDELPPRSDITLRVEPTTKQRAFYEAVRQDCANRIATAKPQKARMLILSEITRLRQAAIDPRLIEPDIGPAGAKIELLLEHIEQLRDEGHRALVFTQFLGSMALVRERLEQEGIEFFELDGSTSAAERSRRIDAFQAGDGDVFLLSLRAGGLGINLTGADYVFHLDPWWNPAVEDQATDRAHRIGQQRPVTVYRLVTEGSIEDKIIDLHATKRQLADDVLDGMGKAAAPDLAELRKLLEA